METQNQNILTREGLAKLKEELKDLVNVQRPHVIQEIKEARDQGDLSENAEFDAARERQGQIEDRIAEIEAILNNSKVVTKSTTSKVRVGSTVVIETIKSGKEETYTIVGSLETDPFNGKISNLSPVAKAILNLEQGDTATVIGVTKYDVRVVSVKNS